MPIHGDDHLTLIEYRLETLEYERYGYTREDITWLVNEIKQLRQEIERLHQNK